MAGQVLNLPRANATVTYYPGLFLLPQQERSASARCLHAHQDNLWYEEDLALAVCRSAKEVFDRCPSDCNERALRHALAQYYEARGALTWVVSSFHAWEKRRTIFTQDHNLQSDPIAARCDGLGFLRIPSFSPDDLVAQANQFGLIHNNNTLKESDLKSDDQGLEGAGAPEVTEVEEVEEEVEVVDNKSALHVPFFFIQHTQCLEPDKEATANHSRMDFVAGVRFLATLGITNFPVFGLVTDGSVGVATCAWGVPDVDGELVRPPL
ncbi:hypothetical protein OF83DRAFT_284437 [Amylostereum chailletii]|nr:hypothetical protein OF83DRAFT_284437 [Amylostereum chailletii]